MTVGDRIRWFRRRSGLTQKQLGELIGFPAKSADIRIAQYESNARKPKHQLISLLANTFQISPDAISVPNIDSPERLMHTLFAVEDQYGFLIDVAISPSVVQGNSRLSEDTIEIQNGIHEWKIKADKLHKGEITKAEYDYWRYCYPYGGDC